MPKKRILIGAALLCMAAGAPYLYFENTALQTTAYAVKSGKLPKDFHGFKIAQISDFHNDQSPALHRRLREAVRAAKPDIIVLTGDLIDRRRADVDTAVRLVRALRIEAPVYFVCGNHDARSEKYLYLAQRLRSEGVRVLENEKVMLQSGEAQICLAGVDDPAKLQDGIDHSLILQWELMRLSLDPQVYTILLSHRPEVLPIYASYGADLVLTGHAHGGQIRLPFVGGLYAPSEGVLPAHTCGLYQEADTQMVVSRGVGNSGFPFRVHNRPELVVVTLEAEEQAFTVLYPPNQGG